MHRAIVLLGLVGWTLLLLILMEALRTRYVVTKAIAANEFKPDNSNLSPFMQRLARAHANCIETLPIFGILLITALTHQSSRCHEPFGSVAARRPRSAVMRPSYIAQRARRECPVSCIRRSNSDCRLLVVGLAVT